MKRGKVVGDLARAPRSGKFAAKSVANDVELRAEAGKALEGMDLTLEVLQWFSGVCLKQREPKALERCATATLVVAAIREMVTEAAAVEGVRYPMPQSTAEVVGDIAMALQSEARSQLALESNAMPAKRRAK